MNTVSSTLYRSIEWITRFAYLNLLWLLFTLAGGIILGFFPSTIAMFAIAREWLKGRTEEPLFRSFLAYFRKDFLKSNLLGLLITVVSALSCFNVWFIQSGVRGFSWIHIPLLAFIMIFLLFLFYLFPTFVHYDLKVSKLIRQAFLIMVANPGHTVLIAICLASILLILVLFPALAFFFGGSSTAFVMMWICLNAFERVQRKQGN